MSAVPATGPIAVELRDVSKRFPGPAGEIVTDGVDGYLVPAEDAAALAAAISRLFDRGALAGFKRAARARYERHPTWADSCAAIRQFLLGYERR